MSWVSGNSEGFRMILDVPSRYTTNKIKTKIEKRSPGLFMYGQTSIIKGELGDRVVQFTEIISVYRKHTCVYLEKKCYNIRCDCSKMQESLPWTLQAQTQAMARQVFLNDK